VDAEAVELMEECLAAEVDVARMSVAECDVPGRSRTVDSLCSIVRQLATLSDGVDVCSTFRHDDFFVLCFGIVYTVAPNVYKE